MGAIICLTQETWDIMHEMKCDVHYIAFSANRGFCLRLSPKLFDDSSQNLVSKSGDQAACLGRDCSNLYCSNVAQLLRLEYCTCHDSKSIECRVFWAHLSCITSSNSHFVRATDLRTFHFLCHGNHWRLRLATSWLSLVCLNDCWYRWLNLNLWNLVTLLAHLERIS